MPVVRIDLIKRDDPTLGRRIGEVVYAAMRETINVPDRDNFQLITEHDAAHFVFDNSYLSIERSDEMVFIHLTISEGRSVELKKALFQAIAEGVHEKTGLRKEDVFIYLVEVKKENWSFGNGVAQYVT
ncbi:tautomerase family protein [Stenotrophomonas sp. PS02289]|uniref:tautomerase family protein n=1 Tax=Stenotrophomonas sp. PS02289 TaxID=2991422 RepID=UPI00249B973D|nr:tautomerase family protein [Stenotrophomonas sp. PS02289]